MCTNIICCLYNNIRRLRWLAHGTGRTSPASPSPHSTNPCHAIINRYNNPFFNHAIVHPKSHSPIPASYILHLTSYFLLLTSYVLLLTSHFLLLTSHFLRLTHYLNNLPFNTTALFPSRYNTCT